MHTIKVRLYKKSKTFFWKLIRVKQNLQKFSWRYAQYSHAELEFENWLSFSSSEVDWGVRIKKIKFKKAHWDFIEIKVSNEKYNKMITFAHSQEWDKYNWLWIVLAQWFNLNFKWEWDWFCSEIVTRCLQESCILCTVSALFVNPAMLAELLEDRWFYINNKK